MPNIPETIIAMLATSSIGAIWTSCSPDFGIQGVLDRFSQIEPKLIFTASGYQYNGKHFDSLEKIQKILSELPSVEKTVIVPFVRSHNTISINNSLLWNDLIETKSDDFLFESLPHHK